MPSAQRTIANYQNSYLKRSCSLLVVDDEEDVRMMLKELLLRKGHRVRAVNDGIEAMDTIQSEEIDLVITDIRMPRMDGIELATWIKKEHADIDVIVITGYASMDTALSSIRLSAFDYLVKPFPDIEVVSQVIDRALDKRQLEEAYRQKCDELLASKRSFSSIVEMATDGIMVNDREGNVLYANSAAKRLLAKGSGKQKLPTGELPLINNGMAEIEILRENGEIGTAELRIDETFWRGRRARLIVLRDITERKKMQAQMAQSDRLASLGVLAAGVAHEVNSPLTFILYNLERLSQDLPLLAQQCQRCLPKLTECGQMAAEASSGAARVRDIVKALKAFLRTENDARCPVQLNVALENASLMVFSQIKHRAQLVKEYGQPPSVMANEGRLTQVFLNLLLNAAQAIEEGDAEHNEIRVRTWQEGAEALVEISDTGAGIPDKHLARIFDPFFTTKGVGVGTGLGLFICYNIISSYQGKIEVQSELGKGTRIRIRLPSVISEETPSPIAQDTRDMAEEAPRLKGRLLVIDDEPTITTVMEVMLENEHEVVTTNSGFEACRIIADDPPFDVILCDFMMPDMSGIDFYNWLQENHPSLSSRLVIVTGGAFTPQGQAFLDSIPNTIIEKPFDYRVLCAKIQDLLREAKKLAK